MPDTDVTVIGGGLVGAAVAYGLLRRGGTVRVLDEGDGDVRASTANFGLVWVNGKGKGFPAYQRWTRRSATLWRPFAAELGALTGVGLDYRQHGGLKICLGEDEVRSGAKDLATLRREAPDLPDDTEVIDRSRLERLLPGARLGQDVVGGTFCAADGDVNPMSLWRALRIAITRLGGEIVAHARVSALDERGGAVRVDSAAGRFASERAVIAAGLATAELAGKVGLKLPLRAERGQIVVTQRLAPFLALPANGLKQTVDGTVLIGTSKENAGLDRAARMGVGARMAARALRICPALETATVVRQWAGLRVMSPDGCPVYARAPGGRVSAAICHSGVTLAAAHAVDLAAAVDGEPAAQNIFRDFTERRFDVPQVEAAI